MEFIQNLFGLNAETLETGQMIARAIFTFFVSLFLIRISGIRMLGKQTAFDNLTTLMMGSILGRGIVAPSQNFFGAIVATCVIMFFHRLIAWITFRSKKAGKIFKGENILLIKEGKRLQKNLERTNITEEDILEALRRDTNAESLDKIKEVHLERSGQISFIKE